MKRIYKILLLLILLNVSIITVNAEEEGINPYIDITFDEVAKENRNHGTVNVFKSDESGYYTNKLISYGIDDNGTFMAWDSDSSAGGGFNLNIDKAIGNDYTIALKFSFADTGEKSGSWRKIIDFQSTTFEDSGFYFYNYGQIQFYPEDSQGPKIKDNEVVDLLIRRNGITNKFDVYNRVGDNSSLTYEFIDDENLSVLSNGLGFFHDDYYTNSEASHAGKVYSVKIWDTCIDVDEAWSALDKEKEDSLKNYVCKKVVGQESTDFIAGWQSYFDCVNIENDTHKYFKDDSYSEEIMDIEKWKTDEGIVLPIKTIDEMIIDLESKLSIYTEENVKSNNEKNIKDISDIIEKIDLKNATEEEKNKFEKLSKRCELLLNKINETNSIVKEVEEAVVTYKDKVITDNEVELIKALISRAQNINTNNLTDEEKESFSKNIKILDELIEKRNKNSIVKEVEEAVVTYKDKVITDNEAELIKALISRAQNINTNNLTDEEKESFSKNNKILENKLVKEEENPQTGDNLIFYMTNAILSLISLSGCVIYINKKMFS